MGPKPKPRPPDLVEIRLSEHGETRVFSRVPRWQADTLRERWQRISPHATIEIREVESERRRELGDH